MADDQLEIVHSGKKLCLSGFKKNDILYKVHTYLVTYGGEQHTVTTYFVVDKVCPKSLTLVRCSGRDKPDVSKPVTGSVCRGYVQDTFVRCEHYRLIPLDNPSVDPIEAYKQFALNERDRNEKLKEEYKLDRQNKYSEGVYFLGDVWAPIGGRTYYQIIHIMPKTCKVKRVKLVDGEFTLNGFKIAYKNKTLKKQSKMLYSKKLGTLEPITPTSGSLTKRAV